MIVKTDIAIPSDVRQYEDLFLFPAEENYATSSTQSTKLLTIHSMSLEH
jgi:hypothetical protein